MKIVETFLASILVLVAVVGTVGLWQLPMTLPAGLPTLHIRIANARPHLADKPDIHVYLKNGSSAPVYVTTNLDPFVSGQGMFRNYFLTLSGAENSSQSTRMFLDAFQLSLNEEQLVQTGIVRLLGPGDTYSGRLPIDTWADLVPEPGLYRISAGYRGTGVSVPLKYPMLEKPLESGAETVVIVE